MFERRRADRVAGLPVLSLLAVTAVWGWTFFPVKDAVSSHPISSFLAFRFALAALVLVPFVRREHFPALIAGAPIGLALAFGYLLQTLGLSYTRASDTGIITGLAVVITPLLDRLLFGAPVRVLTLAAVLVALVGLLMISQGVDPEAGVGNVLVASGAACFALHVVLLSRAAARYDTRALTTGQLLSAAAFVLAVDVLDADGLRAPPVGVIPVLLLTGVGATSIAFLVQTWAQKRLSATSTALLLTAEPAWAALFGVLLAADPFPATRIAGVVILLSAPIVMIAASHRRATR